MMMPGIGQEVVTDRPFHITNITFLKAMREDTAGNVIRFLVTEIFHKFGTPEVIHSDNGAQFTSKIFQNMIDTYKIKNLKTAVYSPQSNASERVNQSVISAIRAYLTEDHRDWYAYLSEIECALRNSVHHSLHYSDIICLRVALIIN